MDSANEESEDPFEVATSLTEDDWKRLERCVNSHTSEWTLPIAAIVMTLSFPVMAVAIWCNVSPLLALVMVIPASVIFYAGWKMMDKGIDDHHLLSRLLREELTSGVRIVPEWFRIDYKVLPTTFYREPPDYTDAEWEKLTRATRTYGKRFLLILIPFMIISGLILALPSLMGIDRLWSLIAMTPLLWYVIIHATIAAFRSEKISILLAMEELTGREFIPRLHRARIGKTWLKMEEDFEEKLARDCGEP